MIVAVLHIGLYNDDHGIYSSRAVFPAFAYGLLSFGCPLPVLARRCRVYFLCDVIVFPHESETSTDSHHAETSIDRSLTLAALIRRITF